MYRLYPEISWTFAWLEWPSKGWMGGGSAHVGDVKILTSISTFVFSTMLLTKEFFRFLKYTVLFINFARNIQFTFLSWLFEDFRLIDGHVTLSQENSL